MVEMRSSYATNFEAKAQLKGEIGICVVEGYIDACGEKIEAGNMLVSKVADTCNIMVGEKTHLLLFGGQPLSEERFIYWNFVASDKEELEFAKKRWKEQSFKMVPGETGYIPLPRY